MASGTINMGQSGNMLAQIVYSFYSNGSVANSSNVSATLQVRKSSNTSTGTKGTWKGSFQVGSQSTSISYYGTIASSWVNVASLSDTVYHNSDGTGSFVLNATINAPSGTSMAGSSLSSYNTITLDTIPRATSAPAISGTIENTIGISISPASSSFTHSIKLAPTSGYVRWLNASGNLSTSEVKLTGSYFNFAIPKEYYSLFTGTSITGSITLYTYSGGTLIGTSSSSFVVGIDKNKCKPTLTSSSLVDVNDTTIGLTGSSSILVKGYSNAKLSFGLQISSANDSYGTVTDLKIDDTSYAVATREITINSINKSSVSVYVKNSRGAENTFAISSSSLVDYVPLTLNLNIQRVSQTGTSINIIYNGNYFNNNFGSKDNILTVTWSYREKGSASWVSGGNLTYTLLDNTYSGNLTPSVEFNYQKNYEFIVYFEDKLSGQKSVQYALGKSVGPFMIAENGIILNGLYLEVEVVEEW